MKPWVKHLIGVLSHIPFVYMLAFFGFIIGIIIYGSTHASNQAATHTQSASSPGFPIAIIALFAVHFLVMFLCIALLTFYAIWILKGSNLPTEAKVIWALMVFFIGPISMPLLYWLHIRKSPDGPYFFGAPLSDKISPTA